MTMHYKTSLSEASAQRVKDAIAFHAGESLVESGIIPDALYEQVAQALLSGKVVRTVISEDILFEFTLKPARND